MHQKWKMEGAGDDEEDMRRLEEAAPQLDLYEPLIEKEKLTNGGLNGHVPNGGTHHVAMIGAKVSPVESLDYE